MNVKQHVVGVVAGIAITAATAGVLVLGGGAAGAATTPPWEPDPSAVGTVSFYDANGTQIYGGTMSDTAPFAKYAVGTTYPRAGDHFGYLQFANPQAGVTPDNWFVEDATAGTILPFTGGPAPIAALGATEPVSVGSADDQTLDGFEGDSVIDPDPNYKNVIQVRLKTANANGTPAAPYDSADIKVDTVNHTWAQIYPAPPAVTATSTTLTAAPSPARAGDSVTLTATESPVTPGSVQFKDGSTDIGSPVAVDGTGKATTSTVFTQGSHSLSAVFTPTSPDFAGSTGTTTLTVDPALITTATTLAASPNPAQEGQSVTLTATESPVTPGSVQFKDGSTDLGTPVAVDGTGKATTTAMLAAGSHSLTAVFTPTSADYVGSTGSTTLTVTPVTSMTKPVVTSVTPASGPVTGGTEIMITGTNFTGADRVTFGTTRVSTLTVVSDTTITVLTPAHSKGYVQVRVHNLSGLSSKSAAARFRYVPVKG